MSASITGYNKYLEIACHTWYIRYKMEKIYIQILCKLVLLTCLINDNLIHVCQTFSCLNITMFSKTDSCQYFISDFITKYHLKATIQMLHYKYIYVDAKYFNLFEYKMVRRRA